MTQKILFVIKHTVLYTLVFGLIATTIFILPLALGFGKTGKNTFVLDKDFSLLSKKDVIGRVDANFKLPVNLTLAGPDRQFTLNTASISAQINSNQIANNLLFRRLNQGISNYVTAFFSPKHFTLDVSYNDSSLSQSVDDLSNQINQPFIPSELSIVNGKVVVKNGQIGRKVDTNQLKSTIISALENYNILSPLPIPFELIGSLPSQSQITSASINAEKLIKKSFVFTGASQDITVDDNTLVSWVGFDNACNQEKINSYALNLVKSIHKDPVDATLNVVGTKVTEFMASADGYDLNTDQFAATLCTQLKASINSTDAVSKFPLSLNIVHPKIKTGDVNNLGIKELLGSGTSTFHHSSDTRNFNVQKGASIINRILVAPGETFSFIKNLGEVTLEAGYKNAYIISQGHTVLDAGGGICQVSTTLFRAMLNAGLNITDRSAHAYRVSYYEEDSKPGFDATVFIPNPDLKFINDTGNYVLIQSIYEDSAKRLTYYIYGTSDGRQAEISNYRQWGWAPAPPDVNIDDPTLKPGQTVQDEHAIPGLNTSFDWKVTRNGQVIHQKTFTSNFVPWAAVFRHGPKI